MSSLWSLFCSHRKYFAFLARIRPLLSILIAIAIGTESSSSWRSEERPARARIQRICIEQFHLHKTPNLKNIFKITAICTARGRLLVLLPPIRPYIPLTPFPSPRSLKAESLGSQRSCALLRPGAGEKGVGACANFARALSCPLT